MKLSETIRLIQEQCSCEQEDNEMLSSSLQRASDLALMVKRKIQDGETLQSWQESKVYLAADYLSSVMDGFAE